MIRTTNSGLEPRTHAPTRTESRALYVTTGLLLITLFTLLNLANAILVANFDFPDILRQPPENALNLYRENFGAVRFGYYIFSLTAVLTIPLAFLLRFTLRRERSVVLGLATLMGVITGVVQVLGFIRWVFLAPALVDMYFGPGASQATRDAVLVVQEAFNRYGGVAVGEHLGRLFNGFWTFLLGVYVAQNRAAFLRPWMGYMMMSWGVLLLLSSAEQFGYAPPFIGWSFLVGYGGFFTGALLFGIFLLFAKPKVR